MSDASAEYEYLPATAQDRDEILQLTLSHFLKIEPHSVALDINAQNGRAFIEGLVTKSLLCPFSYRVVHKATGKNVGVRLMTITERGDKNSSDVDDEEHQEEGVRIYGRIIDRLKTDFWWLRPDAHKVLRREISFVHVDHQRRGIATHLLTVGMDFVRLKESGFDGIVSEASSIANQTLLLKGGFVELARSQPEEYARANGKPVVFPDATREVKLLYLSLQ